MGQKLRLNRLEEPLFRPVDEENEAQRAPEVWPRPQSVGGKVYSDLRLSYCQRPLGTSPRGLYTSGLGQRRSGLAAPHSTYSSPPTPPCPYANTRAHTALPWKSVSSLPAAPRTLHPRNSPFAPSEREWDVRTCSGADGCCVITSHLCVGWCAHPCVDI